MRGTGLAVSAQRMTVKEARLPVRPRTVTVSLAVFLLAAAAAVTEVPDPIVGRWEVRIGSTLFTDSESLDPAGAGERLVFDVDASGNGAAVSKDGEKQLFTWRVEESPRRLMVTFEWDSYYISFLDVGDESWVGLQADAARDAVYTAVWTRLE